MQNDELKKEALDKAENEFKEIAAFMAHMKHLFLKAHRIYFRTQITQEMIMLVIIQCILYKQLAVFADLPFQR